MIERISDPNDALSEFLLWLPGELKYSALKAPYHKKLERAQLDPSHNRSVTHFLREEWHQGHLLAEQGNHHADSHQKTGQSQFAKFAAGLFDKVVMARWIHLGKQESITDDASLTNLIDEALVPLDLASLFTHIVECAEGSEFETPFSETMFGNDEGIPNLQRALCELHEEKDSTNQLFLDATYIGQGLALAATSAYVDYASRHLTADQLRLPISELAETV